MKVIAYIQGYTIPASRFRIIQHVSSSIFREHGVTIELSASPYSSYPPVGTLKRLFWLGYTLINRFLAILKSRKFDVVILQREMISTIYTVERFIARPYVFDVDDAIWLHMRGNSFADFSRNASLVIAANSFIAEELRPYNRKVVIIPTGVDADRFIPNHLISKEKVIVWSGSSGGIKYLVDVVEALKRFFLSFPDWHLRVISDRPPDELEKLLGYIEFVRWSPDIEVTGLQTAAIGIMPLADTEWEKGKASYKMLTYMSVALPIVASPVGMNNEVHDIDRGTGYLAATLDDWVENLSSLAEDEAMRRDMGMRGRKVILQHFSNEIIQAKLVTALKSLTSKID